jgi:hypothetical protein
MLMNAKAVLARALPVALIALFAGPAHAEVTLYATDFAEGQLLQLNLTTGAGTVVGAIPGITEADDLASFGGNLYLVDQVRSTFDLLNPTTAAIISSTSLGAAIAGEGGFAINGSGKAFVSASQGGTGQLFGCNVTVNNSCVAIDAVNALHPSMDGLALNLSGILYGMSQSPVGDANPSLYTIDQTTGATTFIGSTGQVGNDLGGLAVDPMNGVIYSAFNGELYTINASTGAATAVGAVGFNDLSGLAFLNSAAATPEPGTGIALVLGMLALLSRAIARGKTAVPRA